MSVTLRNKKLIENIELQELNERLSLTPVVIPASDSTPTSLSLLSISELSVRTAARAATAEAAESAVTATFGPVGGVRII